MIWFQENATLVWNATGGALVVLFLSLLNQQRRSWKSLVIGCLFGAVGASFVGWAFADWWLVYPACGVAAIMTENLALGVLNLSARFRDDPVNILTHFVKLFVPTFGKSFGETEKDDGAKTTGKPYVEDEPKG